MTEMTDITFALSGRSLPADHAFALWREVVRVLPWIEREPRAGILPLRVPGHAGDLPLPRRARLGLRILAGMSSEALQLSGHALDVGGHIVMVGEARERALQPFPTQHAQLVTGAADEGEFMAEMADELLRLGITGKLICGKSSTLAGGNRLISGYSLVVHELKPQDSLRLQSSGLGGERRYGCGMFVPYKAIGNLDGEAG